MENAADALKMAAAVLMFVLALSVSIVSFGQARQASDVILNYKDRETVYIDGNYYYEASGTERTVSVESIIPAIPCKVKVILRPFKNKSSKSIYINNARQAAKPFAL